MNVAETERLTLRHFAVTDAEFFCRLLNEPSWLQNIGDRGVRSIEDAQQYIQNKTMEMYRTLGFGMYLVESKPDASPIGICGLVKRDSLDAVDLGFALLPEYCGKGYAFEAARAVMDYARVSHGLSRVLAVVVPTNQRSTMLLEKLGFVLQGPIRLAPDSEELRLYATAA